jgi:hypothetical protein
VSPLQKHVLSRWLLALAALSYGGQFAWFGSRCFHQIDIDGIDYIGIARHLRNYQFYSAINDFRSPLLSWMIAVGSFFDGNLVSVGNSEHRQLSSVRISTLFLCEKSLAFRVGCFGRRPLVFSMPRPLRNRC